MGALIKAKNLWFSYDSGNWVLKGVNLEINRGEIVSLIGPNGCGKTTLVKHFNGLLKPTRGKVFVKGQDTSKATVAELARTVGYVFQNPEHQIFSKTVWEEVAFGPRNMGLGPLEELVRSSLEHASLSGFEDRDPFLLSMGEKERLAIASLVSINPEVLILDEPTTGQDGFTCAKIMEVAKRLREKEKTIVLISHDMETVAEYSDRVLVMYRGKIVREGDPDLIFSDIDLLERLSLSPPQIVEIGKKIGLKKPPSSMEGFLERFKNEIRQLH